MPQRTTEQQLADAQQRINRLREKARKEATRKKIIVGAMILQRAESDSNFKAGLLNGLDQFVSKRDRPLFAEIGLPQHNDSTPEPQAEAEAETEMGGNQQDQQE